MDEQASARKLAALGAALAGIGVALGAFGTHGLRPRLSYRELETWTTGVTYQTLYGLAVVALLAVGAAFGRNLLPPARLMLFGAVLFTVVLYALALGGPKWLGAVAPLGGASLIAAWGWAAVSLSRRP